MSNASDLSDAIAHAVETVGPSIVRVEGRHGVPSSGVVWSADAVVVTQHSLERDEGIEVGLPDGSTLPATVAGRDPATDLAVLKVSGGPLTPAKWAELDTLKVGHLVVALARPGKSVRATMGIVNALGGSWRTPSGGKLDRYLQADIGLFPGFSGGALINVDGGVLGITTGGLMRRHSMAIPTPTVRRVVDALLSTGHVKRGFLGVGVYPVRLPSAIEKQVNRATGALVISVAAGSAAEKSGLMQGDVLLALDQHPVHQPSDLVAFLDEDKVGKDVIATIARAGKLEDVTLNVGTRG